MQFGAFMRDEAKDRGLDALALESPFDQLAILEVIEFFRVPECVLSKFLL